MSATATETTHPDFCAHTGTCDPSLEEDWKPWHQSETTVFTEEDADYDLAVLLEYWPGDFGIKEGLTYTVEINRKVDVRIEHARALGEYLIRMADQYGPEAH